MAGRAGLIALALAGAVLGGAAAAPDPVRGLAGRYSHRFLNALMDGERYWSEDIVEVVPVDRTHAYVRVSTQFANGHSCSLHGIAEAVGGTLVYRDTTPPDATGGRCVVTVARRVGALTLDDPTDSCRRYCGARGIVRGTTLPWASRRPITYLARLKASPQFSDAMREWRTGKPVP